MIIHRTKRFTDLQTAGALFLLAVFLRIVLVERFVIGDQIATLREAQNIGSNLQGLPYYVILRLFMVFGDDVLWLRIPSILMGSAAVVIYWRWLRGFRSRQIAAFASILLAISITAIELSQQIRFYALYQFAFANFLFAVTPFVNSQEEKSTSQRIHCLVAAIILALSHLLGVFLVLSSVGLVVISQWYHFAKRTRIAITVLGASLVVMVAVILLSPTILEGIYDLFRRVIAASEADYSRPRGWTVATFAKTVLIPFQLVFGPSTYPLNLPIVVPSVITYSTIAILGILNLIHTGQRFSLHVFIMMGIAPFFVLLLIVEPIVPPEFVASLTFSHMSWLLPLMAWICAEGLVAVRHITVRRTAVISLIAIQLVAYIPYKQTGWRSPDLESYMAFLLNDSASTDSPIVIAGGRAHDFLSQNAPEDMILSSIGTTMDEHLHESSEPREPIVITDITFRYDQRCYANLAVERLYQTYGISRAFVDFPIFAYEFDRNRPQTATISPPPTFYSSRFEYLTLPQTVTFAGEEFILNGAYSLPIECTGNPGWISQPFYPPVVGSRAILFSNFTSSSVVELSQPIAEVSFQSLAGHTVQWEVRASQDTYYYDRDCLNPSCPSAALNWTKYAQLEGNSGYQGANNQFIATIWASEFFFPNDTDVASVSIEATRPDTQFFVWGLFLD